MTDRATQPRSYPEYLDPMYAFFRLTRCVRYQAHGIVYRLHYLVSRSLGGVENSSTEDLQKNQVISLPPTVACGKQHPRTGFRTKVMAPVIQQCRGLLRHLLCCEIWILVAPIAMECSKNFRRHCYGSAICCRAVALQPTLILSPSMTALLLLFSH